MAEVAERMQHDEWLEEAVRRFGPDAKAWRFQCPFCAHVASVQDWLDVGATKDEAAARAPTECIGRKIGAKGGMREGRETNPDGSPAQPCDWAAYGLFGNLGKGPVIVRVIEGQQKETQAFAFAEATT